jgi:hypothetical protein
MTSTAASAAQDLEDAMGKIRFAAFEALSPGAADGPAEQVGSGVSTKAVFDQPDDPIHVRYHDLPAGETLSWSDSEPGHLAFVWEGEVAAGERRLSAGSMIAVEHGGSASVTAAAGGATVLVFNRAIEDDAPMRAGGHVHLLPAERVPRRERMNPDINYGAAIFADSACPTCELWLHETNFPEPGFVVSPHFHTEDEVIVITRGEIVLGRRRFGRGAAISIPRDTVYAFKAGDEGLTFINFRPHHPSYGLPGKPEVMDEQALYRDTLGRPPYVEMA